MVSLARCQCHALQKVRKVACHNHKTRFGMRDTGGPLCFAFWPWPPAHLEEIGPLLCHYTPFMCRCFNNRLLLTGFTAFCFLAGGMSVWATETEESTASGNHGVSIMAEPA